MKRTSRRGFTLVELLVVIGIIAVLISILLPTINKARRSAKTTAGLSNLKQIGLGLRLYATQWKDSLPYGYAEIPNAEEGDWTWWFLQVNSMFTKTGDTTYTTGDNRLSKIFTDPNAQVPNDSYIHYTAHAVAMPDLQYALDAGSTSVKPYKFSDLRTDNVLVWDSIQSMNGNYNYNAYPLGMQMDGGTPMLGYQYLGTTSEEAAKRLYWYLNSADPYASDPWNGNSWPIFPNDNKDGDTGTLNLGAPRWRQRDPKPGYGNANARAPLGVAKGAVNVLFGDGHCETLSNLEFKRSMILLKRP